MQTEILVGYTAGRSARSRRWEGNSQTEIRGPGCGYFDVIQST